MFRTILAAADTVLIAGISPAWAQAAKTIKYTHFQPGREDQPAARRSPSRSMSRRRRTQLQVEIYPAASSATPPPSWRACASALVELAVVHDGGISSMYKAFDIFAMPYLFKNQKVAWAVLDGPFGKEFADGMLKETGIRLMAMPTTASATSPTPRRRSPSRTISRA